MLTVEGYKMFRGEMLVTPVANSPLAPFTVAGDFLYKPDMKCWYCNGRSYPEEVCTVVPPSVNKFDELYGAAQPLQEFLDNHYSAHACAIVTRGKVTVLAEAMVLPLRGVES